ncbi:MAG: hypothetical protein H5T75_02220 [Coriobacteriia bacterium]|nr:hypothetical protein [Coriobacteriia bacterium]
MTLARALAGLMGPYGEQDVVAVMSVFSSRAGTALNLQEVSRLSGLPVERVRRIANVLVDAVVLDFEGGDAYCYERDVAVELELQLLVDRTRAHREHLQDNVARFRSRREQW